MFSIAVGTARRCNCVCAVGSPHPPFAVQHPARADPLALTGIPQDGGASRKNFSQNYRRRFPFCTECFRRNKRPVYEGVLGPILPQERRGWVAQNVKAVGMMQNVHCNRPR
jgi:hypothetical protein